MIDRYTLSKMGGVWSEKHKMDIMLKIELLACEAMTKQGMIPKAALEKIAQLTAAEAKDQLIKLVEKQSADKYY